LYPRSPIVTLAYSFLIEEDQNIEDIINPVYKNILDSFSHNYDLIEVLLAIQCSKSKYKKIERVCRNITKNDLLNVRFIYAGEKGVSKSRNCCIQNSEANYIHFLDNDCQFDRSDIYFYLASLGKSNSFVYFIQSPKVIFKKRFSVSSLFLKYIPHILLGQLKYILLSMSLPSYCLIISKRILDKKNILFDENLGLGTKLPQSEELCLLMQILKKYSFVPSSSIIMDNFVGISQSHLPKLSTVYPNISSKGYILASLFSIFGIVLIPFISILFYYKMSKSVSLLKSFQATFYGFYIYFKYN